MNRLKREGRVGTCMSALLTVLVFMAFVVLFPIITNAQTAFYVEEIKDGRIYVFNDPKQYQMFKDSGELEVRITRIGAGPNGETIYFDSENAIHMYNFKHNLPAEVILKAETPAPTWQEKLPFKLSGYMFGDYFYNAQRDDDITTLSNVALGGPEEFNGFLLRRIYFTYDDDISKDFAVRFRLEADSVSLDSRGKITVFVKDAYLRWKNIGKNEFIFGIQPPPAYEVSEAAWAYRSLEKTIMDLRGIVSSRDIGVSLRGNWMTPASTVTGSWAAMAAETILKRTNTNACTATSIGSPVKNSLSLCIRIGAHYPTLQTQTTRRPSLIIVPTQPHGLPVMV